ncbi:chemotaxis protein [Rhodobacterales bacterium]|nr:chemotaxis protein [Rhodobacterales bacterium]
MTTLPLGMIIEALVAVLLVITIGYCWTLNRRLQRLRADEQVLRATISELMTATEIAERAILGLKTTATEADKTLGTRLKYAEAMSGTLAKQVGEGEKIFARITQIAEAARAASVQRDAPAVQQEVRPVERQSYYEQPAYAPEPVHQPQVAAAPQPQSRSQAQTQPQSRAQHQPQYQAPAEPDRRRGSRASDIRSAAEEATARLEQFRRRNGAAA